MQQSSVLSRIPDSAYAHLPLELTPHFWPGRLVAFCGIDGSGKTTLIEAVARHLEAQGRPCFRTYTPTPRIRNNPLFRELVDAGSADSRARVDVLGLGLQILGDLLQHLQDTIIPRLRAGEVVLCDRYIYTSLGEIRARSSDGETERLLAGLSRRVLRPDLAVALDVSPALAQLRVRQRPAERDKPQDAAFIAHQAASYRQVARENGLLPIDSEQPFQANLQRVLARLEPCLAEMAR